jgi:ADP-ribosyl-[dinitrogen reductase] hydrolase
MTKPTTAQLDRAVGALLGTAAGDALGAGYEFGPPLPADTPVAMVGGGGFGWAPGEWTDDTSMALVIARVAADGVDLRSAAAQDVIAADWAEWARTARDVGAQTRTVLAQAAQSGAVDAEGCRAAAAALHDRTGRTAGNGSLMRTAPVALAYLDDPEALADAAAAISALTHPDPEAGEACVLWCLAIRHAVLTGELDARVGLAAFSPERAAVWAERLDEAEAKPPSEFENNGWVVHALQGAWSAIHRTPVPADRPAEGTFRVQHLRSALEEAVRGGRDTDTVAAIAGGLLGAAYGGTAVPASWRRVLHGWPGLRARDLVALATAIASEEPPFDGDYSLEGDLSAIGRHPYDEGVWIGGYKALRRLPPGVDAVVSLCPIGPDDVPEDAELIEVRLVDLPYPHENPNLGFVLHDTADLLRELRAEGRTVLLHGLRAKSRVPVVAAVYGLRIHNVPSTLVIADVEAVLLGARMNPYFRDALEAVLPVDEEKPAARLRPTRTGPPRRVPKIY